MLAGCSSLGDEVFLSKSLGDVDKARALADRGVEVYNEQVAGEAAYDRLDDVRKYFEVALRYDPDNAKASQYLRKIDDFRGEFVRARLKEARSLAAKKKRSADEDYRMVAAVLAASRADPGDAEAAGLLKQNEKLRSGLAEAYSSESEAAARKAAAASGLQREQFLMEAYASARKAAAVDPSEAAAKRRREALAELRKLVDEHASAASRLTAKYSFEAAEKEVARIAAIDRKAEGAFVAALASATYSLNLAWAKSYEGRQRYPEAAARADKALAARRTQEALALRKRIDEKALALRKRSEEKKAAAGLEAGFDAALADVDRLIEAGDILAASRRMDEAARLTKDQGKLDKLDARRARLRSSLSGVYSKGVAAYRAEDFKAAIGFFQTVVGVDAEYEQAADFLAKAKEKQRLVEQYSQ